MLLTPKRGATTATPRRRPVQKRRQPSSTIDAAADSSDPDRPAAIQSLLSFTKNVTTLMLPPRDLPAVIRRRPVSTRQLSDSHSDSESSGVAEKKQSVNLRPTGSTSDIIGSVV